MPSFSELRRRIFQNPKRVPDLPKDVSLNETRMDDRKFSVRASEAGVDFSTIPDEGHELVDSMDRACSAIGLDIDSVIHAITSDEAFNDPRNRPLLAMRTAAFNIAFALTFIQDKDDNLLGQGERMYLSNDKGKELGIALSEITTHVGFMDLLTHSYSEDAIIPVAQQLRAFAKA